MCSERAAAAFELYATGAYSIPALADELYLRGLKTRASARWPSKQLSDNQLLRLLQDPYYLGFTRFKGNIYPGRHDPLVDGDLFGRVQEVISVRATGERRRIHHHYLKSTLYCGNCHSTDDAHGRIIVAHVNGRGGTYDYFFCRRSQDKLCDAPYMQMARVEDAVERYWDQLRVSPGFIAAARVGLRKTVEKGCPATSVPEKPASTYSSTIWSPICSAFFSQARRWAGSEIPSGS
ncbi:hypothetical protein QE412_003526 [Microbacterium trichothecenolyticum]|uniref:Recombinase domain-containing protein n=1 Tax=Microbacterium trichothecenolyticum TaxID=69370 RepID=A0ABU0TZ69_MICTR|nr:recombinase family protein [Microbacterium trichothecenolyticum]MDQ1124953.1 hypothetical protein [Microbacterium trichothecenolyticum]